MQNQNAKNDSKGITLIALVITIIVLLILAGVTISMVLGDDGIIAQAQDAKQTQIDAEKEQTIEMLKGDAEIGEYLGGLTENEVKTKLGSTFTESNPYNNSIREIKEFTGKDGTKQYLPIPKGMVYTSGTIDDGAVVVDKYGNEYVWVPVDIENDTLKINDETVSEVGSDTVRQEEETKMKESVKIYKGFYVGRYETGGFNSTRVVSKAGENQASCANVTWLDAYDKQKKLHANSTSIVSGMIYNCQWDAIMEWMKDVPNPNVSNAKYINDSTGMGHYSKDEEYNSIAPETPILTGKVKEYSVKNIHNLAGNYMEFTQKIEEDRGPIIRGGDYWVSGYDWPANSERRSW